MMNMWSIAHGATIWAAEPETFRPERFQEEEVSVLGSDFRSAPYAAPARARRWRSPPPTSGLWLAQLLQKFEWRSRWCARPSLGPDQKLLGPESEDFFLSLREDYISRNSD
ncbi:hypothetical protein PR202_gb21326 [Eleusine coracana subsp. coracana]|uniref:Uncharacterized protein n=1 Tax=Eleusine coracana subsp. coracana TaxID=191504 RepID=A0AAV5FCT8_ELECO|nr:hypothetical protein PR202_gb21326 [Eleusine coracana subsp. coracana]